MAEAQLEVDRKKYNGFENVLTTINKKFISLPIEEKKRNTVMLEQVLDHLIQLMQKNVLFKHLYERKFYGGSYYDQLKVGKPEEYDMDIVLNLPSLLEAQIQTTDIPGFVHLRILEYQRFIKSETERRKFPKIETLMDKESYLSVDNVLKWTEKIITAALNELPKDDDGDCNFEVKIDDEKIMKLKAKLKKSFPAFTLKLNGQDLDEVIRFDVDLVPCFQFSSRNWPSEEANYRKNPFPSERAKFLVVPKKPKNVEVKNGDYYWRLSFQEQERDLLKSSDFRVMKSAIKLIKKLRDRQKHVRIASYFIKTVFLWEVQNKNADFWKQTLSYVFVEMLRIYGDYLKNQKIPYYWNDQFNLVSNLKQTTLTDISNRITCILNEIERNLDDPFVIANKFLLPEEVEDLKTEVTLGRKYTKKHQLNSPSTEENDVFSNSEDSCNCGCSKKVRRLEDKIDLLEDEYRKMCKISENLAGRLREIEEQMNKKL